MQPSLPRQDLILNADELERLIDPAGTPEFQDHFAELMQGIVSLAELLQPARPEPPALPPPQPLPEHALAALLRASTPTVSRTSDCLQAALVLADDKQTANERLNKIDDLIHSATR